MDRQDYRFHAGLRPDALPGILPDVRWDLSRTHKERLVANGFLREVIKGWYISIRPDEQKGVTTSWYISFWYFVSVYLEARFGKDWCLSPEQSLLLHSGNRTVPKQLLVRSPKAQNNIVKLLHGNSFFDLKATIPPQNERKKIEGYQVSPALIEQVRRGNWNPNANESDNRQKAAIAARGYWQAFQKVKESIRAVLNSENPGEIADKDHGAWYREFFAPAVTAGIINATDLAGYRNSQVYIKGANHVPPNSAAVRDAMPALFEMLKEEQKPGVRAVLRHFQLCP